MLMRIDQDVVCKGKKGTRIKKKGRRLTRLCKGDDIVNCERQRAGLR